MQADRYDRPLPGDLHSFMADWMETHPVGFIEYREAFGPRGKYGKWIRELPAVTQIGDTIFVHGGIHPSISNLELDEINRRIKKEMKAFDDWTGFLVDEGLIEPFFTLDEIFTAARSELKKLTGTDAPDSIDSLREDKKLRAQVLQALLGMGSWLSNHPDGPLWFRGYAEWNDEEGVAQIEKILSSYNARYFVVGHTITSEDQITQRLDGRVTMIDTVEPTALEIVHDKFTAIYLQSREVLGGNGSASITAETSSH
jgi:hypothetical protein